MKSFIFLFNPEYWKVTGFFPYTSGVTCQLLAQNHNYKSDEHDFLQEIGDTFKNQAEELGCRWDNKVVIEITQNLSKAPNIIVPAKLYISYYDGKISLGTGVWQDEWLKDRNQYF